MGEHNLIDFLDNLIECGQALIPCSEIGVIKANPGGEGIVIESCRGEHLYTDSNISYEEFKEKLRNIRLDLITRESPPPLPQPPQPEDYSEVSPKPLPLTAPLQEVKSPVRIERVMIPIDNPALGSAQGQLPHTSIVDRKTILITNSAGQVLGTGHSDGNGTIIGSNVSGIIFSTGDYRLVFKEYSASEAYISYDVPGEG